MNDELQRQLVRSAPQPQEGSTRTRAVLLVAAVGVFLTGFVARPLWDGKNARSRTFREHLRTMDKHPNAQQREVAISEAEILARELVQRLKNIRENDPVESTRAHAANAIASMSGELRD